MRDWANICAIGKLPSKSKLMSVVGVASLQAFESGKSQSVMSNQPSCCLTQGSRGTMQSQRRSTQCASGSAEHLPGTRRVAANSNQGSAYPVKCPPKPLQGRPNFM